MDIAAEFVSAAVNAFEANKRLAKQVGLKRLFLHAASIEFALEQGRQPYLINAPLPDDLKAVLDRLT